MNSSVLKDARAKVLRAAREKLGLTQEEIAKLVKVAKQTYLKWENGETEPKATQIKLLAEHLEITAGEICEGIIYEKYSLDDFIIEQLTSNAPKDVITMRTWQQIPNHKKFIESLQEKDLFRRKHDIESAKVNYEEFKKNMSEDDRKAMLNAIEKEENKVQEIQDK